MAMTFADLNPIVRALMIEEFEPRSFHQTSFIKVSVSLHLDFKTGQGHFGQHFNLLMNYASRIGSDSQDASNQWNLTF